MKIADFGGRALAPAYLLAKSMRHAGMKGRRRLKEAGRAAKRTGGRLAARLAAADVAGYRFHRLESEARQCPACGSSALELIEPLPLHDAVEGSRVGFTTGCRACGLVFVNPQPDAKRLEAFYSPDGEWARTHERSNREALERQAQRALAGVRKTSPVRRGRDYLLDALSPFAPIHEPPPGAAVLDFGCGDGKFLNPLLEAGWKTFGIEPSSDVAFLRHQKLERVPATPTFDVVLMHHVLEHMRRPLELLSSLAAAMKPEGVLFTSVPRLDTLPAHGELRYCLNSRAHIVAFTESCLGELLRRAGLEPVASLSDRDLDERLTEGAPLRLRMVARKTGRVPPRHVHPLRAARRAFAEYRRLHPRPWLERILPVRVQAYRLDRELRATGRSAAA